MPARGAPSPDAVTAAALVRPRGRRAILGGTEEARMATIVVGIDASAGCEAALRFALREALLRGASLRAVHAWLPAARLAGGSWAVVAPPSSPDGGEQERAEVVREVEQRVRRVQREERAEAVAVSVAVPLGGAGEVLCYESAAADLLVVGSHGHSGLSALVLGSVARECAHRARCPVAVVPPPDAVAAARPPAAPASA
jgi:nucleotide-binding universal stress UspA family protein